MKVGFVLQVVLYISNSDFCLFFSLKIKLSCLLDLRSQWKTPKVSFHILYASKCFIILHSSGPVYVKFFFFFFNNSIDTIREGDLNFELKKFLLQTPWNISWAIKLINLYNAWIFFFFFFFWRGEWPH